MLATVMPAAAVGAVAVMLAAVALGAAVVDPAAVVRRRSSRRSWRQPAQPRVGSRRP
jgi:hypothetical protein